jgi:methyl-accepting chemotaxis protein
MSTDKNHIEPEHSEPTTGASDHHGHEDTHTDKATDAHVQAAAQAQPASLTQAHEEELEGIKMLALDSAELATRSANLATHAGEHMRSVIEKLEASQKKQRKHTLIIFGSAGGLMLIAAMIFAGMSISLKSRINQLDTMVSVVSKRVVELDASMELVGSVNDALQEMVGKQEGIADAQGKLEAKIGESIKSSQGVPEETAKQLDAKNQILAKQVQSLDGRLQSQANAINSLSSIMKNVQGSMTDSTGLKREMENLARIQRERQALEVQATAQANAAAAQASNMAAQQVAQANAAAAAAAAATAAATKQKERMVQYPRPQSTDTTPAGGGGVLSVKP